MRRKPMLFMRATHRVAPTMFVFCFLIAGCTSIPAQIPPQLDDTPGPFVIVEDETLKTDSYWINPPADWKIVKNSIASDPIVIVFASPDDDMIIMVSESLFPAPTKEASLIQEYDEITLSNGQVVHLSGQAPNDHAELFEDVFSEVRESIRLPE